MSIFLEITQLENGDRVLREADEETAEKLEPQQQEVLGAGPTEQAREEDHLASPVQANVQHGSTARTREPLVRISFSTEVRDMLGEDLVGVAEAMIDAATDYLGGETIEMDADELERETPPAPVIH